MDGQDQSDVRSAELQLRDRPIVNRILLVRMSALGDIIHALPVLAALRDAYPSAEIDWVADANYAAILGLVNGITNRVVVRPGFLRALGFMRRRRYDVAIDLQGLIKSAWIARFSGARRVVGFETRALRERPAAWFYHETAPVADHVHIIQKNLSVLAVLGVASRAVRFPFRVPASTVALEVAAAARARGDGRFVLLNPGAAWPNKRWPPDRFGVLARRIRDAYALPSFVLWGQGEERLAETVVAASDGAAVRTPQTSLGDLLALSGGATLMVSGDTGPTHLAAAMGAPIVGLYGPTWPERNGPWDPDDEVISRATSCVCHHKRQCQRPPMCLESVSVDEVLGAVKRRLAKGQRP